MYVRWLSLHGYSHDDHVNSVLIVTFLSLVERRVFIMYQSPSMSLLVKIFPLKRSPKRIAHNRNQSQLLCKVILFII